MTLQSTRIKLLVFFLLSISLLCSAQEDSLHEEYIIIYDTIIEVDTIRHQPEQKRVQPLIEKEKVDPDNSIESEKKPVYSSVGGGRKKKLQFGLQVQIAPLSVLDTYLSFITGYRDKVHNSETALNSFDFGIGGCVKMKKIVLSTSINCMIIRRHIEYEFDDLSEPDSIKTISQNKSQGNLAIPLKFGYKIFEHKHQLYYVNLGVITNIFLYSNGKILDYKNTNVLIEESTMPYRKVYCNYSFSISGLFPLKRTRIAKSFKHPKNVYLILEPFISFSFLPILDEDINVRQTRSIRGLRIALRYYLK